jgi:hypothetical protein
LPVLHESSYTFGVPARSFRSVARAEDSISTGDQQAKTRSRVAVLAALGSLYVAQGVPFGFATEYLPVVCKRSSVRHSFSLSDGTTVAIAFEHFGSGLGTTVLFAALMTATRPADAGLHYTVLTSANALAIGVGGMLGGIFADLTGKLVTFVIAMVVCLLPAILLPRWDEAARASRS